MTVTSVVCSNDQRIHLAPKLDGGGVEIRTLCLERWARREPCREGDSFCFRCVARWNELREVEQ
jgi:hypothetical protein